MWLSFAKKKGRQGNNNHYSFRLNWRIWYQNYTKWRWYEALILTSTYWINSSEKRSSIYIVTCLKHIYILGSRKFNNSHSGPNRTWIHGHGDLQKCFLGSYVKKEKKNPLSYLDDLLYSMDCIPQSPKNPYSNN